MLVTGCTCMLQNNMLKKKVREKIDNLLSTLCCDLKKNKITTRVGFSTKVEAPTKNMCICGNYHKLTEKDLLEFKKRLLGIELLFRNKKEELYSLSVLDYVILMS